MGFLQKLLSCERICIQCHNDPDPDTIASAFGAYRYLQAHGVDAFIVYGGRNPIKKRGVEIMVSQCGIPITYTHDPGEFDLLLLVDCQYGEGNVEPFPAQQVAVIDHHIQVVEPGERVLIKSGYQSSSTILWELLREEGYPMKEDQDLAVALLYGLYIDTSCFADLYGQADLAMRADLFAEQPLFETLTKSSMTLAELMVVSDALHNHFVDVERHFAVVEVLSCEQSLLGIIGDLMIQVDIVYLTFAYTEVGAGYRISLRTCHEQLPADRIAAYVCEGIGSGGGHGKKAGGYIQKSKLLEKYGNRPALEVIESLLRRYIDENVVF